jgi:hypothetical protein
MSNTRYTADEWRFFDHGIRSGKVIKEVLCEMNHRFGHAPSKAAAYKRVSEEYTGNKYSDAYKASVIELAKSGLYANAERLIATLPADTYGKRPLRTTIRRWLKHAGVALESMNKSGRHDFLLEIKQRAIELLNAGHTIAQVRAILAGDYSGPIPSLSAIEHWSRKNGSRKLRADSGTPLMSANRDSIGIHAHQRADKDLPAHTPQWIRDQVVLSAAYGNDTGLDGIVRDCERLSTNARLWWSADQSNNPRWNPAAAGRRLAA